MPVVPKFLDEMLAKYLNKTLSEQELRNALERLSDCEAQNRDLRAENETLRQSLRDGKVPAYSLEDHHKAVLKHMFQRPVDLQISVISRETEVARELVDLAVHELIDWNLAVRKAGDPFANPIKPTPKVYALTLEGKRLAAKLP